MKIYSVVLINELTGNIDHCITSDAPIEAKSIPEPDGVYKGAPTIPPTPNTTWRKLYLEFDSATFTRGRSILNDFEMQGAKAAAKASPTANIQIKKGVINYTAMKETDEATMAVEHTARQAALRDQIVRVL